MAKMEMLIPVESSQERTALVTVLVTRTRRPRHCGSRLGVSHGHGPSPSPWLWQRRRASPGGQPGPDPGRARAAQGLANSESGPGLESLVVAAVGPGHVPGVRRLGVDS